MRKLALRDKILLQIDKAARYIGGEVNAVMKNKDDVDIRFAMAFPDVYEIGMSNLGMMILYDMFNKRDDVWCERLFLRGRIWTRSCVRRRSALYSGVPGSGKGV